MGDLVRLDDERGPWTVVICVCGLCGHKVVSTLQGNADGTFRSFGLECARCGQRSCVGIDLYRRVGEAG